VVVEQFESSLFCEFSCDSELSNCRGSIDEDEFQVWSGDGLEFLKTRDKFLTILFIMFTAPPRMEGFCVSEKSS